MIEFFVVLALIFCFVIVGIINSRNECDSEERISAFFSTLLVPISDHFDALCRNYKIGIYNGEFGERIDKDWKNALFYFYNVVVSKNITSDSIYQRYFIAPWSPELEDVLREVFPEWEIRVFSWEDIPYAQTHKSDVSPNLYNLKMIYAGTRYNSFIDEDTKIQNVVSNIDGFFHSLSFKPSVNTSLEKEVKDPFYYEKYIALCLQQLGFSTYITKNTGDQGVDVVAERNKIKIAIQCKLYSKPVGNKAVQEVNTGREFYQCAYAVVVTNNSFTKSAIQCAKAANVILLHDNELEKLLQYTNLA